MNPDDLPENVRSLLSSQVESLEVLSVLMFLSKERLRAASEAQLCAALKMPVGFLAPAIESLLLERLIGVDPTAPVRSYIYLPADPEVDATVSRLVSEYEANPLKVINFMSASAIERVRKRAVRVFADLFTAKKDADGS